MYPSHALENFSIIMISNCKQTLIVPIKSHQRPALFCAYTWAVLFEFKTPSTSQYHVWFSDNYLLSGENNDPWPLTRLLYRLVLQLLPEVFNSDLVVLLKNITLIMANNDNDNFKLRPRNLFEKFRLNVKVCGNGVVYNGYNMLTTATALVLSTTFQNPWTCDIYCFGGFRIILRVPYRQTRLLLIKSKGRSIDFFFCQKNLYARNKRAHTITTVYKLYRYIAYCGWGTLLNCIINKVETKTSVGYNNNSALQVKK